MSLTATGMRPPAPVPHEQPLGPLALLRTLRVNPLECWTKAHFEELIVVGGFPFARVAVVSDPAAVRQVLVEDQSTYQKAAIERRVLSAGMPNGLVTVDGEQWQRLRRTLAPLFGRTMSARFAPAMARTAAALIERWRRRPEGSTAEIKSEMSRVALEGLVGCMFSDGLGDPESVCLATTRYYETCGGIDPFDVLGLPDFVPRFKRRRKQPVLRAYHEGLSAAIAERRRSFAIDAREPRDLLGAMLAAKDPETGRPMTEAEVKDNVMTFIFGGQETTSSAMTWAIYLLSQSPEWHQRVAREAREVLDDYGRGPIEALEHARAVVEEALRIYPPIVGITRTATRRTTLVGRTIERGTMVVIAPYVLHRHRRLWHEPDLFDPSRFLPDASRAIERYTFLPFGAGPRMCIGAAFAVQEATLVVAALARDFELELVPGQFVWPVVDFTMKPRDGLHMRVRRRYTLADLRAAE